MKAAQSLSIACYQILHDGDKSIRSNFSEVARLPNYKIIQLYKIIQFLLNLWLY